MASSLPLIVPLHAPPRSVATSTTNFPNDRGDDDGDDAVRGGAADEHDCSVSLVGGKGASLVRLCRLRPRRRADRGRDCNGVDEEEDADIRRSGVEARPEGVPVSVPPGFVLTTEFFRPWIEEVESSEEWRRATDLLLLPLRTKGGVGVGGGGHGDGFDDDDGHGREELDGAFSAVKEYALKKSSSFMELDEDRSTALERALEGAFGTNDDGDGKEGGGGGGGGELRVAVRSSSPEEDLGGASFAGLYDTELNILPTLSNDSNNDDDGLMGSIRRCFASCLDVRVWIYKRERGMLDRYLATSSSSSPVLAPSIAVVVQRMVPSVKTAGVAFSLNPLTNDYDEVLINGSWGLGEALVSGDITPDSAVVECISAGGGAGAGAGAGAGGGGAGDLTFRTAEYRVGSKGCGDSSRAGERCLADTELERIASTVKSIECDAYNSDDPVDVEWAIDGDGKLFVLQARPITTYVPLHPSMRTEPGGKDDRRLYMDAFLMEGLTMSTPTTAITNDFTDRMMRDVWGWLFGISPPDIDASKGGMHGYERLYYDISSYMHLFPKDADKLRRNIESGDPLAAKVLTDRELMDRYRPRGKPPKPLRKMSIAWTVLKILWRRPVLWTGLFRPYFRPDSFVEIYHRELREWDEYISRPIDPTQSVSDCIESSFRRMGRVILKATAPALFILTYFMDGLKKFGRAGERERELVDATLRGHEHDIVVRMGMIIYDMTRLLPPSAFDDLDGLSKRIVAARSRRRRGEEEAAGEEAGEEEGEKKECALSSGNDAQEPLSEEFLDEFDSFLAEMGCRGPLEMEVANERYGEEPYTAVLKQMASIATTISGDGDGDAGVFFDPRAAQRRQIEQRDAAYAELLAVVPFYKRRSVRRSYEHYTRWAALGAREMPKHHLVQVVDRVRKLLLIRADTFLREGRIDRREDVFEVTAEDVDRAAVDPNVDLRALKVERSVFVNKLRRHLRHFPMFIDSRGRIVRPTPASPPPPTEGAGEGEDGAGGSRTKHLIGAPVSGGKVKGRVKILNDPFEKRLVKGDILVAVTTDPGWTPLFITASAVILEVGGELQHGALVAREYGKPCVTGIHNVVNVLKDGQMVEVDGDEGIVRVIEEHEA